VETAVARPKHFRKTPLAMSLATVMMGLGADPYAFADALIPVAPPPISSYAGDPGTIGNPASWRTTEFLRDWGLRAMSAEFAYAAGFAGQNTNVGVVDSGYFATNPANVPPIPVGWLPEHADATGVNDRWISVTVTGGTTGPTPGFYNQSYNDTHGTHVSGTVAARRDGGTAPLGVTPNQPVASDMHGVSFNANVSFGNTHKTDGVYYGLQPAGVSDALSLDNAYMGNIYRTVVNSVAPSGAPVRVIHSSWGSQPSTENYNTYCPPVGGTQSFGLLASWDYISKPDGVPDANGHLVHWLNGAIEVARSGKAIISFSAGNGGYIYTTPRGHSPYFLPDLEGRWVAVTGLTTTGQTFNADGSILVPGTETFNQCGLVKWSCVAAPSSGINSTTVTTSQTTCAGLAPCATYGSASGTSMAGPHEASGLNLIMQRFPYMTNDQALYTMYTTGRQNATISNAAGTAVPNPTAGQIVQVPDSRNGWGTVSLRDAFRGPGQLFGRFTVNTHGFSDVWSNNISDVAIRARQQEDAAEEAAWQATGVTQACVSSLPANSSLRQTDFAAGQARTAARATRTYTGQLVKQGDGTLFLTGANTYTGQTTAAEGKLSITGSMTSPVLVSGGTLGGSGTLSGTVSVLSGIIWPGLSPSEAAFINDGVTTAGDALSVGGVKIGPSGAFATTIRSASDYTQVLSGVTAVGGTLMIDLQGTPAPGSVLTIISSTSAVIGTFRGLPEGSTVIAGGQRFTISYLNNKVTLTTQLST
jgi:autotransporter-associated beta strand protein